MPHAASVLSSLSFSVCQDAVLLPHAEPGSIVAFGATPVAVEAHEPANARGCFGGGFLNSVFVRDVAPPQPASWRAGAPPNERRPADEGGASVAYGNVSK